MRLLYRLIGQHLRAPFMDAGAAFPRRFSPADLFRNGEQGAFLEVDDPVRFPGSMFQDSAGTTPVTAVEQPVGCLLDKRFGGTRGNEVVSTFGLSSNVGVPAVGGSDGTLTFSGGTLTIVRNTTDAAGFVNNATALDSTRNYEVLFRVVSGTVAMRYTGGSPINVSNITAGTYRRIVTGGVTGISFWPQNASTTIVIDSISVREVPGNHVLQATAASRPVLSARYNLLTNSEFALGTVGSTPTDWIQRGNVTGTKVADATARSGFVMRVSAPSAGITGASDDVRAAVTTIPGATYRVYGRVKAGAGNTAPSIRLFFTGGTVNVPLNEAFTEFSFNANSTLASHSLFLGSASVGSAVADFEVLDVRLYADSLLAIPPYQRVNTATDYDTNGFPHYLRADGVDDGAATAGPIDLSGSSFATVVAAVTKLSDAGQGTVISTGNPNTVAGALEITGPNLGAGGMGNWTSAASGAVGNSAISRQWGYQAPHSAVVSARVSLNASAADQKVRTFVNGEQSLVSTPVLSGTPTGNLGSGALNIGSRDGTSNRFAGRFYGLFLRGGEMREQDIAQVEAYFARRMGRVLTVDDTELRFNPATLGQFLTRSSTAWGTDSTSYTSGENLITNSDEISSWGRSNVNAPVLNVAVGPDGLQTADRMVEDATNSAKRYFTPGVAFALGTTYTLWSVVKAEARGFSGLSFPSGNFGGASACFNLSTGAVTNVTGLAGSGSESLGNGWWLCWIAAVCTTAGTSTGSVWIQNAAGPVGSVTYQGDGSSGILHAYSQVERRSSPGPRVTTTTAAITNTATGVWTQYAVNVARSAGQSPVGVPSIYREPASTNKVTCFNANPTDAVGTTASTATPNAVTGFSVSGDANGRLSVVNDPGGIAAAGLQAICTSGRVYKLDNSTGAASCTVSVSGSVGNTNSHTLSVWLRGTGSATTHLSGSVVGGSAMTSSYTRISRTQTPTAGTNVQQIRAEAGAVVWFVLPQLEELPFVTSPIVTAGASASRSRDEINLPLAVGAGDAYSHLIDFVIPHALTGFGVSGNRLTGSSFETIINQSGTLSHWNGAVNVSTANGYTASTRGKAAVAVDATGRAVCLNAGTVATAATLAQATTRILLGQLTTGNDNQAPCLHIHEFRLYRNRRMTSTELQALTS